MDIKAIENLVEKDGIIFLSFGGFLSQTLITGMTESLEKEAEANNVNMGTSSNIFTIFIELSQNMMNYSKDDTTEGRDIVPGGLIVVSKDKEGNYLISSQNIVSIEDKEKMEPKLIDITTLDRDTIKKKYRELRKSGQGKSFPRNKRGVGPRDGRVQRNEGLLRVRVSITVEERTVRVL